MKKLTVCLLSLLMLLSVFTLAVHADEGSGEGEAKSVTVTYDNGVYKENKKGESQKVSDKDAKVSKMPDSEISYEENEEFKLQGAPERDGFVFVGWYCEQTKQLYRFDEESEKFYLTYDEETKEYKDEAPVFVAEEDLTLTAVWQKESGGIFAVVWSFLVSLFGKVMWLCAYIAAGNYLLAIFIFAVLFKIVLFPFSIKQQKNSVKAARLAPKQAAIQKKYNGRDDQQSRQRMQQEIMEMQQKEGYNPFGGCGPMILQLVLVFALYEVIRNPLAYISGVDSVSILSALHLPTGMSELNLVSKLAADKGLMEAAQSVVGEFTMPSFTAFGIDLSIIPQDKVFWYVLIPVLTYVGMVLSMKLTRKLTPQPAAQSQDVGCSMKIMDYGMPLMSAYIAFIWPSILGVYWIFQNVLGVLQQLVLKKMYPAPVFTEEDYKEEERKLRTKNKSKNNDGYKKAPDGKQYRSLHHIDDEDETPTPNKKQEEKPAKPREDAPRLKDDK